MTVMNQALVHRITEAHLMETYQ